MFDQCVWILNVNLSIFSQLEKPLLEDAPAILERFFSCNFELWPTTMTVERDLDKVKVC